MSSTPEKNYDNDVAKITNNVLKRFMDEHMPIFMKNPGGSLWLRKVS